MYVQNIPECWLWIEIFKLLNAEKAPAINHISFSLMTGFGSGKHWNLPWTRIERVIYALSSIDKTITNINTNLSSYFVRTPATEAPGRKGQFITNTVVRGGGGGTSCQKPVISLNFIGRMNKEAILSFIKDNLPQSSSQGVIQSPCGGRGTNTLAHAPTDTPQAAKRDVTQRPQTRTCVEARISQMTAHMLGGECESRLTPLMEIIHVRFPLATG